MLVAVRATAIDLDKILEVVGVAKRRQNARAASAGVRKWN